MKTVYTGFGTVYKLLIVASSLPFRKWQQFALDQISMDYVVIDLPEHCKPCRLSSLLEGRPV